MGGGVEGKGKRIFFQGATFFNVPPHHTEFMVMTMIMIMMTIMRMRMKTIRDVINKSRIKGKVVMIM